MIKYAKVRDVKSPTRGYGKKGDRSAGIDFYIPENNIDFVNRLRHINNSVSIQESNPIQISTHKLLIKPHSHVLIPSGICCNLQESDKFLYDEDTGLALIAFNKSSISSKRLDVGATVIDENYQGEIHLSLTNTSNNNVYLKFGQKCIQFVLIPVLLLDFQEVSKDELFSKVSDRNVNGFGSTDK